MMTLNRLPRKTLCDWASFPAGKNWDTLFSLPASTSQIASNSAGAAPVNKEEILTKLQAGELSVDEATKLLNELDAPKRGLYCKVSEKGAVSVYGLQRMPVTLYVEQWNRLLEFSEDLKRFLK